MRLFFLFIPLFFCGCQAKIPQQETAQEITRPPISEAKPLKVGAERTDLYLPQLKGKKVALIVNQTSTIGSAHLVDTLLKNGVEVVKIFAPEHGFRGEADAGETVKNSKDTQTGLPIVSLYGSNKKPSTEQLAGVEQVVFDIQDVGARFYTYISTMHYVMEACGENGIPLMVLDRPNPNGWYVDGPVLDTVNYKSFVGMHPIPVVHGLTVGELAQLIIGEKWVAPEVNLTVIACENYRHQDRYSLPIKPSPNLPNDRSIELYPTLCFFEGTEISVGRGTDKQFQIIGHPDLKQLPAYNFEFTPVPMAGAKYPKHEGVQCHGLDLRTGFSPTHPFSVELILKVYQDFPDKENFFKSFFDKLAGTDALKKQIEAGLSAAEIRKSWQASLTDYLKMRKAYLLYAE